MTPDGKLYPNQKNHNGALWFVKKRCNNDITLLETT